MIYILLSKQKKFGNTPVSFVRPAAFNLARAHSRTAGDTPSIAAAWNIPLDTVKAVPSEGGGSPCAHGVMFRKVWHPFEVLASAHKINGVSK